MTHPDLERAAGPAAPVLAAVTRMGFAAKGVITILVGVLALRYALRHGGGITSQEGAVAYVLRHPLGRWMLAVLAVGLASYALWMYVAAYVDPERKGENLQGIAERLGFFATGVGYTLLASTAFALLFGRRDEGGPDLQHLVATVLTPHVGRIVVGLAGLIVMTAGLLQLRLGLTRKFRHTLQAELSRLVRLLTGVSGTLGYLTLGLLSLTVGWSLVEVAVTYDPSKASGWPEALWRLSHAGEGRWLLGTAAAGLICYGFYFLLQVRYRRL